LLKQQGIESVQLRGAREYASIVTGIGDASIEVFVEEAELPEAQKVLSQYLKKTHLHVVEDTSERGHPAQVGASGSFGKIVFFSVAGAVVLPVVLNIFAAYHLYYFLKVKDETLFSKMVAASIVIAGWAGSVALIYVTLTHLMNY